MFLEIQNPKSTNLAGSLDGAPLYSTNSKTKTLSRDRRILQSFIHTVGIPCFLSIRRLQCDCEWDLRARCAAAVRSHNMTRLLWESAGLGGALSAVRTQCVRSATIWASSRTGDPYFVILGGIIVAPNVDFDDSSTLGIRHFWTFTHSHPFPPLFILFCSSPPWTPTLWCRPLSWGDGLPGFCLTTIQCPMRGRITADKDVWLYHKWKPEFDVDSLLQATLPHGPAEDEVDTYEALALAGRVSELSNAATLKHSDFVFS